MKKYSTVIFDVDGTLLDTREGIMDSVEYTIDVHKLKPLDESTLLSFIGPPVQESFQKAYGLEGEVIQELTTTFRNRYKGVGLLKAIPYDGIYEVCNSLKTQGVKIAVATYKRQDYARMVLKHFRFDEYSDVIYGADHQNKLTKTDIIRKCIDNLGVKNYKEVLMIGDSSYDAIGSEQIGINFLGVTYGFDFRTEKDVMQYQAIGSAAEPLDILHYI